MKDTSRAGARHGRQLDVSARKTYARTTFFEDERGLNSSIIHFVVRGKVG